MPKIIAPASFHDSETVGKSTIDREGGVLTLNAEAKLEPATDHGMH